MSLHNNIEKLFAACKKQGIMIATVESCTAGLISGALTDVAGSSAVLDRGFVTYSNAAKSEMLGIDAALIDEHGAVSEIVAKAMAEGALMHSNAALAVAVTGIAGPDGGSDDKPVGLVHFACAMEGTDTVTEYHVFSGDRKAVRQKTVGRAIEMMLSSLRGGL